MWQGMATDRRAPGKLTLIEMRREHCQTFKCLLYCINLLATADIKGMYIFSYLWWS